MVMAPSPAIRRQRFLRWRIRCLIGKHELTDLCLRLPGETWETRISYCTNCHHVVGPSRAEKKLERS